MRKNVATFLNKEQDLVLDLSHVSFEDVDCWDCYSNWKLLKSVRIDSLNGAVPSLVKLNNLFAQLFGQPMVTDYYIPFFGVGVGSSSPTRDFNKTSLLYKLKYNMEGEYAGTIGVYVSETTNHECTADIYFGFEDRGNSQLTDDFKTY